MENKKCVLILARFGFPFHDWIQLPKVIFLPTQFNNFYDTLTHKKYVLIEHFDNYETNGNVELRAIELHSKYHFTHIVFQAEQDIIRTARLRKALGLEQSGQSLSSALCFRDKCIMKSWLNEKLPPNIKEGIYIPKFAPVLNPTTILKFVDEHKLPVVVKPSRGMGSMDTYILKTEEDYLQLLGKGLSKHLDGPIDYIIEEFITGQMYHIDGFVDNGILKLIWPSVYMNTCVGYLESKFLGSYSLSAKNPLTNRLIDAVRDILKVMDAPRSYSFHVELWHNPEDKLVFCEAASRTGGAGVATVMLELFEVNLNKAIVQAQCEEPITSPLPDNYMNQTVPGRSVGWIVVFPKPGELKQIPKICSLPYVIDYEPTTRTSFSSIEHCTDALASFIVEGATEEVIRQNIEKSVNWFLYSVIWQDVAKE